MSFAWTPRLALGALVLAACHAEGAAGSPSGTWDGGAAEGAALPPIALTPQAADLCPDGTGVCAKPSTDVALVVTGAPGEILLALEGDYGDSTLSADDLQVTSGGISVTLHTASVATTYQVMARYAKRSGNGTALGVAVSAAGFALVDAAPAYNGHRWSSLSQIYGTVSTIRSCNQLGQSPAPDTDPWFSAKRDVAVELTEPAGTALAVDFRIGHYAYGCVDLAPLPASATPRSTTVDIYDVPMVLSATDLDASFTIVADPAAPSAWPNAMSAAAQRVEGGFFASGSEATALLDAVRATLASSYDQQQFDALRTKGSWDSTATSWLGTKSLHTLASNWLDAQKGSALGPLALHLAGGTAPHTAAVRATSFSGLGAAAAAIAPPSAFAWSADADDTVHLSGEVDVSTDPFVAHLADATASQSVSGATDVPSAIAASIDAAGLAQKLVGSGVSYGSCAAACTANAILAALSQVWATAYTSPASASDSARFTLTASAPATVGDRAEPLGFAGKWIGQAAGPAFASPFALSGSVLAQSPPGVR